MCVRKICRDTFGHDLDKWQMCFISMLNCCWAMWTTHNNHDIWRFPKIGVPKVIISSDYRNHPFVFRKHQVINSQIENRTVYKFIDGIFPELNHPAIGGTPITMEPPVCWSFFQMGSALSQWVAEKQARKMVLHIVIRIKTRICSTDIYILCYIYYIIYVQFYLFLCSYLFIYFHFLNLIKCEPLQGIKRNPEKE